MAGVVFGGDDDQGLGKWSERITIAASSTVPPGVWVLSVAATFTDEDGTFTIPAGALVNSDGKSFTIGSTAGAGMLLGARPKPVWPWPKPWPLNLPGMT
jgi:hypothetical protein